MKEFGQAIAYPLGRIEDAVACVDPARREAYECNDAADHARVQHPIARDRFDDGNVSWRQVKTGRAARLESQAL
ncbi:MAG: hypothetical protein AB7U49_08190 [Hyphomicrobiaceae bacterium]